MGLTVDLPGPPPGCKNGNSIFLWNFHVLKNGSCVERCQNGAFFVHTHSGVHSDPVTARSPGHTVGVNTSVGVNKKRPILTPFHTTSIFQDVEFPQKNGISIFSRRGLGSLGRTRPREAYSVHPCDARRAPQEHGARRRTDHHTSAHTPLGPSARPHRTYCHAHPNSLLSPRAGRRVQCTDHYRPGPCCCQPVEASPHESLVCAVGPLNGESVGDVVIHIDLVPRDATVCG